MQANGIALIEIYLTSQSTHILQLTASGVEQNKHLKVLSRGCGPFLVPGFRADFLLPILRESCFGLAIKVERDKGVENSFQRPRFNRVIYRSRVACRVGRRALARMEANIRCSAEARRSLTSMAPSWSFTAFNDSKRSEKRIVRTNRDAEHAAPIVCALSRRVFGLP